MLKYYDFSGVSFLVEKSFECENASENATARFVQPGTLIEVIQFWIPPGRCITWEMGGSQFTMTLCTGLSQTTKNDNGNGSHSRFLGFVTIPCMGSW